MPCTIYNCVGEYEERESVHTMRHQDRVVVFDRVPAEVCPVCGDVLLRPEVVRRIEAILQRQDPPAALVPLYDYARPD